MDGHGIFQFPDLSGCVVMGILRNSAMWDLVNCSIGQSGSLQAPLSTTRSHFSVLKSHQHVHSNLFVMPLYQKLYAVDNSSIDVSSCFWALTAQLYHNFANSEIKSTINNEWCP